MAATFFDYAALLGRVLLSTIFLLSGFMKMTSWTQTADHMAIQGLPYVPILLGLAIAVELAGGLALLLGLQSRTGALMLFLYLIPTTLVFHNFWDFQGAGRQDQMFHFLKNLAIMGGLLECYAFGPGALSVDAKLAWARPSLGWPRPRRTV